MRKPPAKSLKAQHAATAAATRAIREGAPEGCLEEVAGSTRVLTRAGWARVRADVAHTSPGIWLFVKFETPCLARAIGLDSNENTGKWNHLLDLRDVEGQVARLFGRLWPRGPHELAEATFFGHVQDEIEAEESRRFRASVGIGRDQPRKRLAVLRACGAVSTGAPHGWCEACGTAYAAQDAARFWSTAGYFLLGDRTTYPPRGCA